MPYATQPVELETTSLKSDANLKAYYRFLTGALATDSSPNGVTLTNNNSVQEGTGRFGVGADFGSNNTVKYLKSTNTLSIDGGSCSLSCWFKANQEIASGLWALLDHRNTNTKTGAAIYYDYNGGNRKIWMARLRAGAAWDAVNFNITLGTNDWFHFAYTYDGATVRAYINGVLVGSIASSGNGVNAVTNGFGVGADADGGSPASGIIDDVAIFNRTLTQREVQILAGYSTNATEVEKSVWKGSSVLKAYYRLESGALVTDSSGNNKTLTNNNTVAETAAVIGGGADFGAANTNKYLSISEAIIDPTADYAISLWVKLNTEISSGTYDFLRIENNTAKHVIYIRYNYNGGTRQLQLQQDRWLLIGQSVVYTVNLGTSWHHLLLSKSGQYLRAYLDGAYIGVSSAMDNNVGNTATNNILLIGAGDTVGTGTINNYSSAAIDDVAIFSTALTPEQVRELYEGRLHGEVYPQSGLVGLWHLNGHSKDFSGGNYHGSDTAITYSKSNGKFGQGAGFNGSSSLINIGNQSAFNFGTGDFTCSFWLKTSTNNYQGGVSKRDTTPKGWSLNMDNANHIEFLCGAVGGYGATSSISPYATGNWVHVVGTRVGNTLKLYINGKLDNTGVDSTTRDVSTTLDLVFGKFYPNSGTFFLTGAIDDVAIWNRALSAQEISRMYAKSVGKFY